MARSFADQPWSVPLVPVADSAALASFLQHPEVEVGEHHPLVIHQRFGKDGILWERLGARREDGAGSEGRGHRLVAQRTHEGGVDDEVLVLDSAGMAAPPDALVAAPGL